MCVVKTGREVQTLADLQNLVTSAILRQLGLFDEKKVCEYTAERLKGSAYEKKKFIVNETIKNTLFTLSHSSTLILHGNNYQIQDINSF